MKEKLKKIDFKHLLIVLLITLLIGACVLVICLLNKYDENHSKTILNKNDDEITLNSSYHLNNSGDLVSDNLFNYNLVKNGGVGGVYPVSSYAVDNGSIIIYDRGSESWDRLSLKIYFNSGSYSFTCSLDNYTKIIVCDASENIILDTGSNYLGSLFNFNITTSGYYYIYFYAWNSSSITYENIMLNSGSTPLPYEPYGVWYANASATDDNNNILSNYISAKFYYNSSNVYSATNLNLSYNVNYGFTFLDLFDGEDFEHLDYIDLLYDSITINNSLLYVLTNGVGASCHIVFYNNNTSVLDFNYPYVINDTNTSDDMPFPIEISGSYTFNKVRVYNLRPNGDYGINFNSLYLNSSNASYNYLLGFQDGYNRGLEDVSSSASDYANLQSQYNSLDVNYQTLLEQYNTLLNQSDYSFSELFWSISSVPFGVLTSAFNVNVLGVNLRGIITGLFTALLLIWLIRRLF